jgi:hypothetical protein
VWMNRICEKWRARDNFNEAKARESTNVSILSRAPYIIKRISGRNKNFNRAGNSSVHAVLFLLQRFVYYMVSLLHGFVRLNHARKNALRSFVKRNASAATDTIHFNSRDYPAWVIFKDWKLLEATAGRII